MMKSRSVIDEIEELLDALDLAQARTDAWRANPQWFFPDGMHPNRHAHRKLYEYIKPQLGL
jgi:lysophospholipase L1-like esterase